MRKLMLILVLAALPVAMLAQDTSPDPSGTNLPSQEPTKEQKEYFARQIDLFAQYLADRAASVTSIQCDSAVPRDCLELAARSTNRRDELLVWFRFESCDRLEDLEKLKCLHRIGLAREQKMDAWRKEWKPNLFR